MVYEVGYFASLFFLAIAKLLNGFVLLLVFKPVN